MSGSDSAVTKLQSSWLFAGFALLILGSFVGFHLISEKSTTLAREQQELLAKTMTIEQLLNSQLISMYRILDSIRDDWVGHEHDAYFNDRLAILKAGLPGVRSFVLMDRDGKALASNRSELRDRDFKAGTAFQHIKNNPSPDTLYLSSPYVTVLGTYTVNVARTISSREGEFSGVVMAILDPEFFSPILSSVLSSQDMRATILHSDGTLFMYKPMLDGVLGKNLAIRGSLFSRHMESGVAVNLYTGPTSLSHDNRITALRSIRPADLKMDHFLVVTCSRDLNQTLGAWRSDMRVLAGFYLIFALISCLSLLAYNRRKIMEGLLTRSQRDFKAVLDNMPSIIGYWDKDLRNRFANHAYFTWFGIDPENMPGMHIRDVIGEERYLLNLPHIESALAGTPQMFERAFSSLDGRRTYYFLTHYIPDVVGGDVQGFYALVTDITSIKEVEEVIVASLKEKEILLKEIHHRVKNNLQIISSLLSLQQHGLKNKKIRNIFDDSIFRITSMAMIHEQLYRSQDLSEINVKDYLQQLIPQLVLAYKGDRDISQVLDLSPITLTLDQSIPFGLIINELVTNALKHGFRDGRRGTIRVSTSLSDETVTVVIKDDGIGLSQDINLAEAETLGLQIVTMLTDQLRGELSVDIAEGTTVRLDFPHRAPHAEVN